MKLIKDLITGKNASFDSISKTVQEIFQIFLHSSKDVATKEGLAKVLAFFDADRIYIGYFNDRESTISFMHECTAEGVENATGLLNKRFKHKKQYEEKDYPFWIGNIKNGIDTIIADVDKLPMISETEIPLMKENNVRSSITTSIHEDGKVCGFLGMEHVNRKHKWDTSEIEAVHFFANIFSVVIENEFMHKEIMNSSLEAFKNETIFRIIFETLPVGIELYDEKGILRKINPYDLELLGAEEEDLLGVNLFENPTISKESLEQIRKGEPTTFENDYHFDKINNSGYYPSQNKGKVMRLIGKYVPLKDRDNIVFGYLVLVYHDTGYYKKEQELRANLAKLREKDIELIKIREFNNIRTTFISNISHEIRTPLNAILGFSKIIADTNKAEETQYFNDIIQQNNEILLHMIDSILSFTQIEAGPIQYRKEYIDIKEICHSALNLKSFAGRPEIEFTFDESQPPLTVYTDKEYTKQVIYHLLDNADKFTEKGNISLSYRKNEEGEVLVEISDTGIGLTAGEMDKVFERFYKIDDIQRGVGLGLSIVRRFVGDLGGKVGVESEKGKGSRFWFTLPCSGLAEA